MSEADKQEARELADRAARQTKQAARNAGRAAKAAGPVVVEATGDVVEKVNDVTEDAVDDVVRTTRKFGPRLINRISSDTGVGFLALSVAIYAGAIAVNKFGIAYSHRRTVTRPSVRAVQ